MPKHWTKSPAKQLEESGGTRKAKVRHDSSAILWQTTPDPYLLVSWITKGAECSKPKLLVQLSDGRTWQFIGIAKQFYFDLRHRPDPAELLSQLVTMHPDCEWVKKKSPQQIEWENQVDSWFSTLEGMGDMYWASF